MACESEVLGIVGSTVLLCYDVFDVEGKIRIIALMNSAVLAVIAGPSTDETPESVIH